MSDKYKILRLSPKSGRNSNYAILVLTSGFQKQADTYDILMPDVGDYTNAHIVLKTLNDREERFKLQKEQAERERAESLNLPHYFRKATDQGDICICARPESDELHIEEDEDAAE